jgi:hypothetical protein
LAVSNFIPSVWGARLLENLHKVQVYGQPPVINRDYECDISAQGDTVRINAIGPVTVYDYAKNSDINAPEQLTDAQTVLTVHCLNHSAAFDRSLCRDALPRSKLLPFAEIFKFLVIVDRLIFQCDLVSCHAVILHLD